MPSFTGTAVADEARVLLNNTAATLYTNTALLPIINKVLDDLLLDLLEVNAPVLIRTATAVAVAALATSITPSSVNARFVEPISLSERPTGFTGQYSPMIEKRFIPDETQNDRLRYWAWTNETIELLGATSANQVLIRYTALLPNLAAIGDSITITGAKSYMAAKTAAIASWSIGQNPTNADVMNTLAAKERDKLLVTIAKKAQSLPMRRPAYIRPRRRIYI